MSDLTWDQVKQAVKQLQPVRGGFTTAKRGLIEIDGQRYFFKQATDEQTKRWLEREIRVYRFLEEIGFHSTPKLITSSPDGQGMCLEALHEGDGWDWSNNYSIERVNSVFELIDELEKRGSSKAKEMELFSKPRITKDNHGWSILLADDELLEKVKQKLLEQDHGQVVADLSDLKKHRQIYEQFEFGLDSLVHLDIRGDNCAWHRDSGVSKLIDWNWANMGDKWIDWAAFLTNVEVRGLDVVKNFPDKLKAGAFHWLAGMWFQIMVAENKPDRLAEHQLQSAVTAFKIASKLS